MEEVKASGKLVSRYQIPIIDLGDIGSITAPRDSYLQEIAKQLKHALLTKGLVYFINHGITADKLKSVNNIFDTFCALPDDVKKQYNVSPPEVRQGYIPCGLERLDNKEKVEARDAFNIQDMTGRLPTKEVPNFKEVIGGVVEDFFNLSVLVLKLLAIALELDFEKFMDFHKSMMKGDDNLTTFRMLYYPPLKREQLGKFTRCGEHSDWGTFTLLTEDSEGGLEVFDGQEWSPVCHMPGAILLNLGDTMELWTSSEYKAMKHRVVVPEDTELQTKGRHSLAIFIHPDNSTPLNSSFLRHCRFGEELDKSNGLNEYEYTLIKLKEAFY